MDALDLAAQHRIAPLLYDGLLDCAGNDPNWTAFLPFLQTIQTENAKNNRKLQEGVVRIAEQLSKLRITAAFLKGAAVVLESENYAPWRQLTDLDILVDQADVPKLTSALLNLGYCEKYDYSDVESGLHHHYPPLYNKDSDIFLELHIRLMQDPKENLLSTAEILNQARPIKRGGHTLFIPRPEHRMTHLIAHAQISNWGYLLRRLLLKDLVDAAELCGRHQLDWNIVDSAFKTIGAQKALLGFLAALHTVMGTELPFQCNRGNAWAREAVNALHMQQGRLRNSVRIIGKYIRLFTRNPMRLKLVWQTFNNRAQFERLLMVTRARIKLPH